MALPHLRRLSVSLPMRPSLPGLLAPVLALLLNLSGAAAAEDVPDYSAAEQALFMTDHLRDVSAPTVLRYRFHKEGALEAGFDDEVSIVLEARADGSCCDARGNFLSGARRIALPDIEDAQGNPAILYFLEHDVRDMQRLTQGQPNHFRRRIRMAIYQDARVLETRFEFKGQSISGRTISVTPYVDDPNRVRFEQHAGKEYLFMLSDEVPGHVFGIRTRSGPVGGLGEPLIVEEMIIDGGAPPAETLPTTAEASR